MGWCCMCHYSGETVEHLLLHCSVAFMLWSFLFRSFGFHWVLLEMVIELLFGWMARLGRQAVFGYLELCPIMFNVDFAVGT